MRPGRGCRSRPAHRPTERRFAREREGASLSPALSDLAFHATAVRADAGNGHQPLRRLVGLDRRGEFLVDHGDRLVERVDLANERTQRGAHAIGDHDLAVAVEAVGGQALQVIGVLRALRRPAAHSRRKSETIPFEVCEALAELVLQHHRLDEAIARLDGTIAKMAQKDETARRLMSIPGFGPITASEMAATVQDASSFAGPGEFAAFLGLTPKQNSSGGKPKLGRISKMGNRNLHRPSKTSQSAKKG